MINITPTKSLIAIGIITACLLTTTAITHQNVSAKKPDDKGDKGKDKKKSDVKVHVKVNGIPVGTGAISATLTVGANSPQIRTQTLDDNETSLAINFNKISASKGDTFTVTVNDRVVDGKITETKKPNKVTVNLS